MYACNTTETNDYEFASFMLSNVEKVLKNTNPINRKNILYKIKEIFDEYNLEG